MVLVNAGEVQVGVVISTVLVMLGKLLLQRNEAVLRGECGGCECGGCYLGVGVGRCFWGRDGRGEGSLGWWDCHKGRDIVRLDVQCKTL